MAVTGAHSIQLHGLVIHGNNAAVDAFQPLFSSRSEDWTTGRAATAPADRVADGVVDPMGT